MAAPATRPFALSMSHVRSGLLACARQRYAPTRLGPPAAHLRSLATGGYTAATRYTGPRTHLGLRTIASSRVLAEQRDKPATGDGKLGAGVTAKVTAATSKILSALPSSGQLQHENIYTVPNILTFSRLVAAPVVGWAILADHPTLALSLFAYAAVTDLVDGLIARRFGQESVVGTIIDPMADKLLMTIGVVCLSVQSSIPFWLATLIIGRDAGLGLSALYFRWISLPPPKTMARYWDFSLPSAEVKPTLISKVNTALQLLLVGSALGMPVMSDALLAAWHAQEAMVGLQYLVGATTVLSGLSYVFSKTAVKILSEKDVQLRLARQGHGQGQQQRRRTPGSGGASSQARP
ncbi:cardiolipin synthase [Ascosphaera acerosa]|nr:cardiolipin synthase [Ascosphaera acerosa]